MECSFYLLMKVVGTGSYILNFPIWQMYLCSGILGNRNFEKPFFIVIAPFPLAFNFAVRGH